jgi:hypothetical protein
MIMPYIKEEDRLKYQHDLMSLNARLTVGNEIPEGELNFLISTLIADLLKHYGLNYANANKLMGVLECSKLELYRRLIAPYEDTKVNENGDVGYDEI